MKYIACVISAAAFFAHSASARPGPALSAMRVPALHQRNIPTPASPAPGIGNFIPDPATSANWPGNFSKLLLGPGPNGSSTRGSSCDDNNGNQPQTVPLPSGVLMGLVGLAGVATAAHRRAKHVSRDL